jgi:Domain of unknown function (DUF6457)
VHPYRGVQVWVGRGHDGGHGATGGKPGDVDASRIDEEIAPGFEMSDPTGELVAELANTLGLPVLSSAEIDAVLDLASAAAHGTGDRTSTPLVSFIAGLAAQGDPNRLALIEHVRQQITQIAQPPQG